MATHSPPGVPVLLAHSYYLQHDPKQLRRMKPYSPLATLIAGGALRESGFNVSIFDAMLSPGVHEFAARLDAKPDDLEAPAAGLELDGLDGAGPDIQSDQGTGSTKHATPRSASA